MAASDSSRSAIKVCKFGGTSLAGAAQIQQVEAILRADPGRRYVVPSAPGKRRAGDQKITDLLYLCHESAEHHVSFNEAFGIVADRFEEIVRGLKLTLDLDGLLGQVRRDIVAYARAGQGPDYAASRGEFLHAHVLGAYLGVPMVDAAEVVHFDAAGRLDEARTYVAVAQRVGALERAVVPGFYGRLPDGRIKTLSRGGSDVTGAIVARGVGAAVYENWTDVSGLLMADPRIVEGPQVIDTLTYRELRELSYSGATVLHEDAVFPVRDASIPVNIRNTHAPGEPGTTIVAEADRRQIHPGMITGIAGRRDFTLINLDKTGMNSELGFGRRVLAVLERHGINFEHVPSGIDTLSVVVGDGELKGRIDQVLEDLRAELHPDALETDANLALIATVGRGMAATPGMAAKLFTALAQAGVNIRMIDQGSSELNIIVGVDAGDFDAAVRAIYAAFVAPAGA